MLTKRVRAKLSKIREVALVAISHSAKLHELLRATSYVAHGAWISSKRSNPLDPRDIHELHIPCEMPSHARHTRCDNCELHGMCKSGQGL